MHTANTRTDATKARGIPKAVHEGAKAAGGDVLEPADSARVDRKRDMPSLTESAARMVMARVIESRSGGIDGIALVQQTAADLVRGAGDVDGNIIDTVTGAVTGAIEAAQDTGLDRRRAAEAAAIGAIEAAGDFGEVAVEHVKKVVTAPIGTVRPLDTAMFADGRRTP